MAKKEKLKWSRWYCGITHLEVRRGPNGGKDVATITKLAGKKCQLSIYNTHDVSIFSDDSNLKVYPSVEKAMKAACRRFGVSAEKPDAEVHPDYVKRIT